MDNSSLIIKNSKFELIETQDSIISHNNSPEKGIILKDIEVQGINAGHKFPIRTYKLLLKDHTFDGSNNQIYRSMFDFRKTSFTIEVNVKLT